MMYIEQAPLGGNLLKILKNSASLSNGTATKQSNAVNGESLQPLQNGNCRAQYLKPLKSIGRRVFSEREELKQAQELLASTEEGEEEEHYELIDVVDDTERIDSQKNLENRNDTLPNGYEIEIDLGDCIENNTNSKGGQILLDHNATSDTDDEYEWRVVKVLKRKPRNKLNTNYKICFEPEKQHPPVPAALSIEDFRKNCSKRLLNGVSKRTNSTTATAHEQPQQSIYDSSAYSCFESGLEDRTFDDYQTLDEQMGIDILGGIRQLFNWRPKTNASNRNTEATEPESGKRKRRPENSSNDGHFKYRKVENNFPKIITHTLDDDAAEFPAYHAPPSLRQRNPNASEFLHPNKKSFEMTQRGTEEKSRRSWFELPRTSKKTMRHTCYADIEFSDDDDDDGTQRLQKSLGIAPTLLNSTARKQPRVINIPIRQEQPQTHGVSSTTTLNSSQQPPLSVPRRYVTPHTLFNVEPMRKPTYADAVRLTMPFSSVGHVLNGRNLSSNASSASGTSISRIGNDFGNMSRLNTKALGRSILIQDREKEEHEKYKQLLETINRAQYNGSNISNSLISGNISKRSRILPKFVLPTLTHRVPLSSTINIDDDDDNFDDVTITGVTHLKSTKPPKRREAISTVVLVDDNDDISEIIDLDKELPKKKTTEVIDLDAKENKHNDLPYVEPVNSFRDMLNTIPNLKETWFHNFNTKWEEKRKLRQAEVNKTLEITDKLTAERRAAESELQERLQDFRIVDPELLVVDDFAEPEVEEEPEFPELNDERQKRIKAAVYGPLEQVLVEKFNMNITRRDIQTLLGHNWLNDEVINFYMNLITERSELKHESHGYPTVYAMNTFFLQRLSQNGHGGVKRWTRKVNIFEKDVIPVPVHVGGVHWCMAIIHLKKRWIRYYDSMGAPNPGVLKLLEQYLKDESLDKRKQPFDTSGFVIESVREVPRQMNGSDCGVFSCMFAEYISRNKEITFSQQHMEYFRHKMILEIVQGELLF